MKLLHLSLALLLIMSTGCQVAPNDRVENARIDMLKRSENYPELIEYFKIQLAKKENAEHRLELADAYVNFGDYKFAILTVEPLLKNPKNLKAKMVYGDALFGLERFDEAIAQYEQLLSHSDTRAKAENALGVVYAAKGDYKRARQYFHAAREHFYSDIVIKNNIAFLDILEGHYQRAIDRLMPMYINGVEDETLEYNLMLSLAKTDQLQLMKRLFNKKYRDNEIVKRYMALKSLENKSN